MQANDAEKANKNTTIDPDITNPTTKGNLLDDLVNDAREATAKEHQMSLWEGIKLYPRAVGWSVLLSTAIVMEGYDTALMGSFFAYPSFQAKYGTPLGDGTYGLSAPWQAGLSNGVNVGEILGLFVNGIVSERYGYRKTMIVSLVAAIAFIFILFFAQNVETLLVGEILIGIPLGVFQTLTVAYASEVCPVVLRCYLTTYVNLCWVFGQYQSSSASLLLLRAPGGWCGRAASPRQRCR